jgi:hypothetical protein
MNPSSAATAAPLAVSGRGISAPEGTENFYILNVFLCVLCALCG